MLMVPSNYFAKNYIKHAAWAQMWREALRVDSTVVNDRAQWVAPVGKKKSPSDEIVRAACETLKYSVKPADMVADPEWLLELTRQVRKLRFVSSGRVLKHVLREDDEREADLLGLREENSDDAETPSMFFGWRRLEKRYKRENHNARIHV
jgi:plasmid rolling circle replication initiator protein Rep